MGSVRMVSPMPQSWMMRMFSVLKVVFFLLKVPKMLQMVLPSNLSSFLMRGTAIGVITQSAFINLYCYGNC